MKISSSIFLTFLLILPLAMFAMVPWNGSQIEYSSVQAQTVQWNQTYGTIGRDEAGE